MLKRSVNVIVIAICLHIVSAFGLAFMSYSGYSELGYFGAILAVGLTFLRPCLRLYEYVTHQLSNIRQEVKFPRDDIQLLKEKIHNLEDKTKEFEYALDLENVDSYVSSIQRNLNVIEKDIEKLNVVLETLKVENKTEHELLARKSEEAIAQLSEDSQFLNHAREIIRFFKKA